MSLVLVVVTEAWLEYMLANLLSKKISEVEIE